MAVARNKAPVRQPAAQEPSQFVAATASAGVRCETGKAAVQGIYRSQIEFRTGCSCTGSVDLDAAFADTEPNAPRWDYGLGLRPGIGPEMVIWVESHPASSTKEVERMLRKLEWLKAKLASPPFRKLRALRDSAESCNTKPYRWLTMPSGSIRIAPSSKEARRLAQAGLDMPRKQLLLP